VKISIITPSVRPQGLELVNKALRRQTFTDTEWLVDMDDTKNKGDYWGIYKAYNRLIKKAKGELIISWQDYTYANPDTLGKFWQHYQDEPKTIVGAVGNKYVDDKWTVMTWKDPRERADKGSYHYCKFNEIELNLASFPREAFYAVGGFDETLDAYSSLCGLDVLVRLNILGGWDFKLDQTIKTYSLEHGRLPDWEENSPFHGVWDTKLQDYNKQPILSYLKTHTNNK
jgi:hypothetical protein